MLRAFRGRGPLEHFIVDPPITMPFEALGVTPVGTKMFEDKRTGIWHVMDWVGSEHYPNTADFVEEVRRMGASRRLSPTLDYSLLTPGSQMILIHARAWVGNTAAYLDWNCPKAIPDHKLRTSDAEDVECDDALVPTSIATGGEWCCAGVWWRDIETVDGNAPGSAVVCRMPAFTYAARSRPEGLQPQHRPAVFMRLPIRNIDVVRAMDGSHKKAYDRASRAGVPVNEEDE